MRTHTDEKTYKYDQSKKGFTQVIYLAKHMTTHLGEKPYMCNQCDDSLKQHMRTHFGEKPYTCNQCGKYF